MAARVYLRGEALTREGSELVTPRGGDHRAGWPAKDDPGRRPEPSCHRTRVPDRTVVFEGELATVVPTGGNERVRSPRELARAMLELQSWTF